MLLLSSHRSGVEQPFIMPKIWWICGADSAKILLKTSVLPGSSIKTLKSLQDVIGQEKEKEVCNVRSLHRAHTQILTHTGKEKVRR